MSPFDPPELAAYPTVRTVVADHGALFLYDARTLLQVTGCNFAVALSLSSFIVGLAEYVFSPAPAHRPSCDNPDCRSTRSVWGTRKRVEALLLRYFPWPPDIAGPERLELAVALYRFLRTPMVHRFGIIAKGERQVFVGKPPRPLTVSEVEQLESGSPPLWPPIERVEDTGGALGGHPHAYVVDVAALYWATVQTLRNFARDADEMRAAEARLRRKHIAQP